MTALETRHSLQPRKRIGDILLAHTSLTPEQLDEALKIQKKEGGLLGEILVRKNMILPHEIMRALCVQIDLTFIEDLKPNDIDPKLVSPIPINYAKTKEILPIAIDESGNTKRLVVATSDPFNDSVAHDLRVLTGMPI